MANNVQQHKVTRSYLSLWVGENGRQVYLYDLDENKFRLANPHKIFTERYFNDSDNIKADGLLSNIEKKVIPTLKEVGLTRKISNLQKVQLCTLIASQRLRTDFAKKVVRQVTLDFMKSKVNDLIHSPEQFEEAIKKMLSAGTIREEQAAFMRVNRESLLETDAAVQLEDDKDLFLSNIIKQVDKQAEFYATWEWTLFIAQEASSFITSDNPVSTTTLYDRTTQKPVVSEVHFPLSPQICLRMVRPIAIPPSRLRYTIPVVLLNKKQIQEVNARLVCEADRYIIANSESYITRIAKLYRQTYLIHKADRKISYGDPAHTPASTLSFQHILVEPR